MANVSLSSKRSMKTGEKTHYRNKTLTLQFFWWCKIFSNPKKIDSPIFLVVLDFLESKEDLHWPVMNAITIHCTITKILIFLRNRLILTKSRRQNESSKNTTNKFKSVNRPKQVKLSYKLSFWAKRVEDFGLFWPIDVHNIHYCSGGNFNGFVKIISK